MTRETSIETYKQIKEEGLLSRMRFYTYSLLCKYGPLTALELAKVAKDLDPSLPPRDNFHKRLSELRDRGVAIELCERPCTISGRTAILWAKQEGLPIEPEKKKSKVELRIERAILLEREACARIAEDYSANAAALIRRRDV